MIVLGLDTANAKGEVALLRDDFVLDYLRHEADEDYSTWLLPAVESVLRKSQVNLSDVDVFGVAAGPGLFTALRVGLTTVKAWGEVYGKPIVPVSRLELIAWQAWGGTDYVASWAAANRGEVFGAVYRRTGNGLERLGDEIVTYPGKFVQLAAEQAAGQKIAWASSDVDCMFDTPEWKAREPLSEGFELVSSFLAIGIARMAATRVAAGRYTDALGLDAEYVRRPDAELLWKGRAGSGT
jgi:tRNA threonylcarbamoyladenosine biosynthesis protein TsaB